MPDLNASNATRCPTCCSASGRPSRCWAHRAMVTPRGRMPDLNASNANRTTVPYVLLGVTATVALLGAQGDGETPQVRMTYLPG